MGCRGARVGTPGGAWPITEMAGGPERPALRSSTDVASEPADRRGTADAQVARAPSSSASIRAADRWQPVDEPVRAHGVEAGCGDQPRHVPCRGVYLFNRA